MSLLCRNLRSWSGFLYFLGIFTAGEALCADRYFIPDINVGAEQHTNIDLTTSSNKEALNGYAASAAGIFGMRTPRNVTEVRPRLEFSDYPDRDELRRTNKYLDFNSRYRSLRSEWEVVASFWEEDTLEAQRIEAEYDEFDPNDPSVDTPSRISLVTETRTRIQARPSYTYRFSERIGTEIEAFYQTVNFDSEGVDENVDYDYLLGRGSLLWSFTPRTGMGAGLYGAKFKANNADEVNAQGASLGFSHEWSQTFSGLASVNVEQTEVESGLTGEKERSTNTGIDMALQRRGQISMFRFNAGRTFTPSSIGSRIIVDQIRFQYTRNFRPRWNYSVAARGYRSRRQGGEGESRDNRDYARLEAQLNWNMTRTLYIGGGYSYLWRKYVSDQDYADDHVFSLRIGYRGLRPQ